jgi:hypothetical protein
LLLSVSDQIAAKSIQAGSEILLSEIHKSINSIWNKEELTYQWKESIFVPVYKKGDKTDYSYYREISINLSNILLSRLSQYICEIIEDQCGFRPSILTTYHVLLFVRYWRKNGNTMRQ